MTNSQGQNANYNGQSFEKYLSDRCCKIMEDMQIPYGRYRNKEADHYWNLRCQDIKDPGLFASYPVVLLEQVHVDIVSFPTNALLKADLVGGNGLNEFFLVEARTQSIAGTTIDKLTGRIQTLMMDTLFQKKFIIIGGNVLRSHQQRLREYADHFSSQFRPEFIDRFHREMRFVTPDEFLDWYRAFILKGLDQQIQSVAA